MQHRDCTTEMSAKKSVTITQNVNGKEKKRLFAEKFIKL